MPASTKPADVARIWRIGVLIAELYRRRSAWPLNDGHDRHPATFSTISRHAGRWPLSPSRPHQLDERSSRPWDRHVRLRTSGRFARYAHCIPATAAHTEVRDQLGGQKGGLLYLDVGDESRPRSDRRGLYGSESR